MNLHQQFFDRIGQPALSRKRIVIAYLIFGILFGLVTPANFTRSVHPDGRATIEYGIGLKWLVVSEPLVPAPEASWELIEIRPLNLMGSLLASGGFYTLLLAGWIFRYRIVPEAQLKRWPI